MPMSPPVMLPPDCCCCMAGGGAPAAAGRGGGARGRGAARRGTRRYEGEPRQRNVSRRTRSRARRKRTGRARAPGLLPPPPLRRPMLFEFRVGFRARARRRVHATRRAPAKSRRLGEFPPSTTLIARSAVLSIITISWRNEYHHGLLRRRLRLSLRSRPTHRPYLSRLLSLAGSSSRRVRRTRRTTGLRPRGSALVSPPPPALVE